MNPLFGAPFLKRKRAGETEKRERVSIRNCARVSAVSAPITRRSNYSDFARWTRLPRIHLVAAIT